MVSKKKSRVQASKMTIFTTVQRIWIVEQSSTLISPVKIKREFVKRYSIALVAASKLKRHHFSFILQRFVGSDEEERWLKTEYWDSRKHRETANSY